MLPQFELFIPKTLEEASRLLLETGGKARIYAGGTDVLVQMSKGQSKPEYLIDIKKIKILYGMDYSEKNELVIGALTTHHELEQSKIIRDNYPVLFDGVSRIGSVQTRNRGTIGGNLCSALPSADSAGPLLVLGARLRIFGPEGEREVPVEEFFVKAKQTVLKPGELLTHIILSPPAKLYGQAYTKFSRRKAMDLALLGVAVHFEFEEDKLSCRDARIALTTAASTPIRAYEAEQFLRGKTITEDVLKQTGELASKEAKPRDSWRSSADYRRHLIRVLMPRVGKTAYSRLKGEGRA